MIQKRGLRSGSLLTHCFCQGTLSLRYQLDILPTPRLKSLEIVGFSTPFWDTARDTARTHCVRISSSFESFDIEVD